MPELFEWILPVYFGLLLRHLVLKRRQFLILFCFGVGAIKRGDTCTVLQEAGGDKVQEHLERGECSKKRSHDFLGAETGELQAHMR